MTCTVNLYQLKYHTGNVSINEKKNITLAILACRSPPKPESTGQASPASSPRSLKKFALGLRQSQSLGRGAFAKEDWFFYQKRTEKPQVMPLESLQNYEIFIMKDCPECGRTFGSGAGLSCHMRKTHR